MKREKLLKCVRTIFYIAFLATILFIFVNSALSKEQSGAQSDAVGDFIAGIIPPETALGAAIQENLRKIAHFTEYGLLGIEVAFYIFIFESKRVKKALLTPIIPFFVGFFDETIQIFSERGPSVSDVWIDIGGFAFFSALSYITLTIACAAHVLIRRAKEKRGK